VATSLSLEADAGRVTLTDRHLRALAARGEAAEVRDAQQSGLVVRVLPSGILQFTVRYRHHGKQRRLKLGSYPAVSLAAARRRARAAQSDIDDARDPVAERAAAKAPLTDTVNALADSYLKKHARRLKRSAAFDERALDRDVLPYWGGRRVRDLRRRDVRELLERVVERGSPIMANRLLSLVRKLLNFAVDEEWIDANPAARLSKPAKERSRERVLTDEELRRLWRLLGRPVSTEARPAPGRPSLRLAPSADPYCPVSPPLAAARRIQLLTAQRGIEVIRMRWADVDLVSGWWTIPATDSKNGEPHRVPLTPPVIGILRDQHEHQEKLSARPAGVFCGADGQTLEHRAKKASAAIQQALGVDFPCHDFRRTAATRMAEAGVSHEHIGRVLNHVDGARATRVYDRHSYDPQKRLALETWARNLLAIVADRPAPADVISISSLR